MASVVRKYWQVVAYIVTAAVGAGVTMNSVQANSARVDRLERWVQQIDAGQVASDKLLERIDERTAWIQEELRQRK